MSAPEVLVTGGTGVLGSRVVERLGCASVEARVLGRGGRSGTMRGNLITGEGLEPAVHGVDTVIHYASSPFRKTPQTDVEGTRRLLRAATSAGVSHVVYISIVGVDHVAPYPYYRGKLDAERVIEGSTVPYIILWATQLHDFALMAVRLLERLPVMVVPNGFPGQPIDAGEVADHLVEITRSGPAGYAQDVGGPEIRTLPDTVCGSSR